MFFENMNGTQGALNSFSIGIIGVFVITLFFSVCLCIWLEGITICVSCRIGIEFLFFTLRTVFTNINSIYVIYVFSMYPTMFVCLWGV